MEYYIYHYCTCHSGQKTLLPIHIQACFILRYKTVFLCIESSILWPKQWFSTWGHWQHLKINLIVTSHTGRGQPLESNEYRPGMLLNILQCTGQLPEQRMVSSAPQTSILLRLRNFMLKYTGGYTRRAELSGGRVFQDSKRFGGSLQFSRSNSPLQMLFVLNSTVYVKTLKKTLKRKKVPHYSKWLLIIYGFLFRLFHKLLFCINVDTHLLM